MGFLCSCFCLPFRALKPVAALVASLLFLLAWVFSVIFVWPVLSLHQLVFSCKKRTALDQAPPSPVSIPESARLDMEKGTPRVAIVGSGWTGLTVAKTLIDRGVQVTIFEAMDDVGGTWHPSVTYAGLSIHSPLYYVEIDGFPHPEMATKRYERISAREVHKYLCDFTEKFSLRQHITFGSKVTKINHDTRTNTGSVTVMDKTGAETVHNNFNMVVHTAFTSKPNVPKFEGHEEFAGEILHSSEVTTAKIDELIAANKKVVVLGASKSAVDILLNFVRKGYADMTWLYRKSYYFLNYEHIGAHQQHNSVFGRIRGFFFILALSMSTLSTHLSCFLAWLIGTIDTIVDTHFDLRRCHLGTLKKAEFEDLRKHKKRHKGELSSMTVSTVEVDQGHTSIPCDVLISCTGYRTGLSSVLYTVDGKSVSLNTKARLYQNFVLPQMPTLAFSVGGFYTIGPRRGVTIAEHLLRYMHLKPSQEEMVRSAKHNFLQTDLTNPALFSSEQTVLKLFILWMIDSLREGLFSMSDIFMLSYEPYVHNRVPTLHIHDLDGILRQKEPRRPNLVRNESLKDLDL